MSYTTQVYVPALELKKSPSLPTWFWVVLFSLFVKAMVPVMLQAQHRMVVCEEVRPGVFAYEQGAYSHRIKGMEKSVPLKVRISNAKRICNGD